MDKRDGWKRGDDRYYLVRSGKIIGTVYRTANGMWCWSSRVSTVGGYRATMRSAKEALVASVEASRGQA
jgi:hypothetical protein